MSRQSENENLLQPAFLYGANAGYIEDLQARFEADPNSVDPEWRTFFGALKDDPASVLKTAKGASWQQPNWPVPMNGELVSALDGNWGQVERVIGEKIRTKAEAKGAASTIRSAPS